MLKDKDDLSWYARKAAGLRGGTDAPAPGPSKKAAGLSRQLASAGIKGSIEERTLYTRRLPPGCRGCLGGKGTNLYVTGLCTRDCFFCFNEKPRKDELVVHGIKVREPEEAREIVERYHLRSVGLSGGEPLLFPDRVLRIVKALRAMPVRVRIDLYTNGDRVDEKILLGLKKAGVDSLRFNLAANGYDTGPVELSLKHFPGTTVEVPVVPSEMEKQRDMVLRLDSLGVPFLNIHELFACRENVPKVGGEGYAPKAQRGETLLWRPVEGGDEACLELLLFALKNTERLSVYYCSCITQDRIGQRGLRRRQRLVR